MATMLKFEVFDVFNRKQHKMNPIGQAQCEVKQLLMSMEQIMRLEVLYDGVVCGYLTVRAWRVSMWAIIWVYLTVRAWRVSMWAIIIMGMVTRCLFAPRLKVFDTLFT